MFRRFGVTSIALALAIGLPSIASADDSRREDGVPKPEGRDAKALTITDDASSGENLGKQWSQILAPLNTAELRRLAITSNDSSLAVAAAWRAYLKSDGNLADHQRFVGFVEGKCHVPLFAEYEVNLMSLSHRHDEQAIVEFSRRFPENVSKDAVRDQIKGYKRRYAEVDFAYGANSSVKKETSPGKQRISGTGSFVMFRVFGRESTQLARDGDKFIISEGPHRLAVSLKTMESMLAKGGSILMAEFHGDRAAVALADSDPEPFSVFCFDVTNGKQLWDATVWSGGPDHRFIRNGPSKHFAKIVLTPDRVAIMGYGYSDSYLEVFDIKDGSPQVRFATDLWNNPIPFGK